MQCPREQSERFQSFCGFTHTKDTNSRIGPFHADSIERLQKRCVIDLDGDWAIAVELVRHLAEWSSLKSYLLLQPGQGLLHVDGVG